MPWYKVIIVNNENAVWSILGLMRKFILMYKLIGSPKDAVVYRGVNDLGDHIYYFSPQASVIAIAEKFFTHLMSQSVLNSLTWTDLRRLLSSDMVMHT